MELQRACLFFLSLTLVLATAQGCAHSPAAQAKGGESSAPAAAPDPARLIDYYATPKGVVRDYHELKIITVLGWGRTQDEQIAELKERARDAGADGVILFAEDLTSEASLNYSDSTCQTDSVQLQGVAIVYDEDRQPAGN